MLETNLARYRGDLAKLIKLGRDLFLDIYLRSLERQGKLNKQQQDLKKTVADSFEKSYQRWYTEACAVLKQLLPERHAEFQAFYHPASKRKVIEASSYAIQDWLIGLRTDPLERFHVDELGVVVMRFKAQLDILESIGTRFESSLFDIRQLVQADLLDSELDASRELLKAGFLRAAGAVAGVVLEKHLAQVCRNHLIPIQKKDPTIGDLNDALKSANVIDVPVWRSIQRLADLRNLATHNKQREPTESEIQELIDGVEKSTKTLY